MKTERTSLCERGVSRHGCGWRLRSALALGLLVAAVALPTPSSQPSQAIEVSSSTQLLTLTSPGGLTQSSPTSSPATALATSSPQGGSSSSAQLTASAATRNGTPMNHVQFSLRGKANETYLIQATTDLATWSVIATNQASSDGVIQFTDSDAGDFSQRFYRGLRLSATIASVRPD